MPTTQISLIREHTEKIKPPRALWVPFELGRPLGVPNDAMFQTKVLVAALRLLDEPTGPVLHDFTEEAPSLLKDSASGWACPLDLSTEAVDLTDMEQLRVAFGREFNEMRSWYELGVKRRGRTTFGVSGLDQESIRDFVIGFLDGSLPSNPREDLPLGLMLKLAADDLKTYYFEAATAQPGKVAPSGEVLADWFWQKTLAAKVLRAVKDSCMNSDDRMLKGVGERLLIPMKHSF
ncbi:MAG: hypothetical protein HY912_04520 [Desulfomonile tiedjei]|uniref:Uncharacterized protein n=1 Tax=Desulfomonile tiedjei TaxID=2358 RepID=A0A9D6UYP9_9BACT|nr:hypothetical protein [Desulfomonile tiedjei]